MYKLLFDVIDPKTGQYPDCEKIALTEEWAKELLDCSILRFNEPHRKPLSITISIPGVPDVALRKNRGNTTHWDRQRAARAMRDNAAMLILEQIGTKRPHYPTAGVCITQYYCGRPLDYEALASGMGSAIDAFIDRCIIEDDRPDRYLLDYQLRYVRVKHKDLARVEVTMRDASAG